MGEFAGYLARMLHVSEDVTSALKSCGHKTERYSLFKVGPVLVASVSMGMAQKGQALARLLLKRLALPLLERRTHDRKVASSNLGRSGGRRFLSGVNFLC